MNDDKYSFKRFGVPLSEIKENDENEGPEATDAAPKSKPLGQSAKQGKTNAKAEKKSTLGAKLANIS